MRARVATLVAGTRQQFASALEKRGWQGAAVALALAAGLRDATVLPALLSVVSVGLLWQSLDEVSVRHRRALGAASATERALRQAQEARSHLEGQLRQAERRLGQLESACRFSEAELKAAEAGRGSDTAAPAGGPLTTLRGRRARALASRRQLRKHLDTLLVGIAQLQAGEPPEGRPSLPLPAAASTAAPRPPAAAAAQVPVPVAAQAAAAAEPAAQPAVEAAANAAPKPSAAAPEDDSDNEPGMFHEDSIPWEGAVPRGGLHPPAAAVFTIGARGYSVDSATEEPGLAIRTMSSISEGSSVGRMKPLVAQAQSPAALGGNSPPRSPSAAGAEGGTKTPLKHTEEKAASEASKDGDADFRQSSPNSSAGVTAGQAATGSEPGSGEETRADVGQVQESDATSGSVGSYLGVVSTSMDENLNRLKEQAATWFGFGMRPLPSAEGI